MRKLLLILNAAARTRALDTETAGRRTGGLEVVDSIMPETARRALKKRVEAVAETMLVHPPAGQCRLRAQMEDVLEVYRHPADDRFPMVCVDETSKQLVSETRVPLAPVPGQLARYDYEYRHQRVCNLFMMAASQQGWHTVQVTARRTKLDFATIRRWLFYPVAHEVARV